MGSLRRFFWAPTTWDVVFYLEFGIFSFCHWEHNPILIVKTGKKPPPQKTGVSTCSLFSYQHLKFISLVHRGQSSLIICHLQYYTEIDYKLITLCRVPTSRHVKINGSPVSLTENSAVFRKTDLKKKITDFKSAHSLTVFLLKAISCDNLAEVAETFSRDLTILHWSC